MNVLSVIFGNRPLSEGEKTAASYAVRWVERKCGVSVERACRSESEREGAGGAVLDYVDERILQVMTAIRSSVPEVFGKTYEEVFTRSRRAETVFMRACCYKAFYDNVTCTGSKTESAFGIKRLTIRSAVKSLDNWMESSPSTRSRYIKFNNAVRRHLTDSSKKRLAAIPPTA